MLERNTVINEMNASQATRGEEIQQPSRRPSNTRKDNVCLPCLSDFSYKNGYAHLGIIVSSTATLACLFNGALLMALGYFAKHEESRQYFLDVGGKTFATGLGCAAVTAIGFFAGTTRNQPSEVVDETSALVQRVRNV